MLLLVFHQTTTFHSSDFSLWKVIVNFVSRFNWNSLFITFSIFKATKVNRLHIINQSWYFSSSFSLFCLCYFVGLNNTSCWNRNSNSSRFIFTRTVCFWWSSTLFGTLSNLLENSDYWQSTLKQLNFNLPVAEEHDEWRHHFRLE